MQHGETSSSQLMQGSQLVVQLFLTTHVRKHNKLRAQVCTSLSGIAMFDRGRQTYRISVQNVNVDSPCFCTTSI